MLKRRWCAVKIKTAQHLRSQEEGRGWFPTPPSHSKSHNNPKSMKLGAILSEKHCACVPARPYGRMDGLVRNPPRSLTFLFQSELRSEATTRLWSCDGEFDAQIALRCYRGVRFAWATESSISDPQLAVRRAVKLEILNVKLQNVATWDRQFPVASYCWGGEWVSWADQSSRVLSDCEEVSVCAANIRSAPAGVFLEREWSTILADNTAIWISDQQTTWTWSKTKQKRYSTAGTVACWQAFRCVRWTHREGELEAREGERGALLFPPLAPSFPSSRVQNTTESLQAGHQYCGRFSGQTTTKMTEKIPNQSGNVIIWLQTSWSYSTAHVSPSFTTPYVM